MPALLQAGFRVLRIDMRGHGGSDPVAGDYTMADLAGDVAAVLDGLAIPRVHYIGLSIGGMLGQAFALDHQDKLISILWCDTLPASPLGAQAAWDERMGIVRRANSLEPIADATMDRWFTAAFKTKNPQRWKQIRDTIIATTPAGYLGCSAAILDFDFAARLAVVRRADPGGLRRRRRRHPGGREHEARRPRARRALRGDRRDAAFPQCRGARSLQPHHARLARSAEAAPIIVIPAKAEIQGNRLDAYPGLPPSRA